MKAKLLYTLFMLGSAIYLLGILAAFNGCATVDQQTSPPKTVDELFLVNQEADNTCVGYGLQPEYVSRLTARVGTKLTSTTRAWLDNGIRSRCNETIYIESYYHIRGVGSCEVMYPLRESCRFNYVKRYQRLRQ
jgi:hypothetical protein